MDIFKAHISVDKPQSYDVLERVDVLNAAMFRVLLGSRLIEVLESDYRAGSMTLLLEGRESPTPLRPGRVTVNIELVNPRRTRLVSRR